MATINSDDFEKNLINNKILPEENCIKEKVNVLDKTIQQFIFEDLEYCIELIPSANKEGIYTEVWLYELDSEFKMFCEIMEENEEYINKDITEYLPYIIETYSNCYECRCIDWENHCDMISEGEFEDLFDEDDEKEMGDSE